MPNWTDENGFSWFGILECKRCLTRFKSDSRGEVPPHSCHGGIFDSVSENGEWHMPRFLKKKDSIK